MSDTAQEILAELQAIRAAEEDAAASPAAAFDWSMILKMLLPVLLPVLIPVFLPLIEKWLGVDLDDAAIISVIQSIVGVLFPSAIAGYTAYAGTKLWAGHRERMAAIASFAKDPPA